MTPQAKMLTQMKTGQEDDGGLTLNWFYGQNEDFIKEHLSAAEEMYKKVFRAFLSSWYILYSRGKFKHVPPKEWETFKV